MSMKIKVSYTDDEEELIISMLLKPLMQSFKVKKSTGKAPYKHLYFIPKNSRKADE